MKLSVPGLLVASLVWAVPAAEAQSSVSVVGRVLDYQGDAAVAGARVELLDARERRLNTTNADSAGMFGFDRVRPGTYRLRVESFGYRRVTTPALTVEDEPLEVVVRLAADAVPLAPLEVVTRAPPPRAHTNVELSGFYERALRGMGGTFITREEIDTRGPSRVTDLIKTVGSMTATGDAIVNMRGACGPAIFLDGRRISGMSGGNAGTHPRNSYEAANSVDPSTLEGVEVHRGPATLPAQYAGFTGACGAVLLWSKR